MTSRPPLAARETNRRYNRVLIANRGEIACRVIKAAHRLGLATVAVYTDADRLAPHVRMADFSVNIGEGPSATSYLDITKILKAANDFGADAIHPGYGFLSENAGFAQACEDAGLVFIGPSSDSIRAMGDKAASKRLMIETGVPCIPGYQGDDQSEKHLLIEAKRIGFPLMIKASAGGGGRGMRIVHTADEVSQALVSARSEARSAFGDDRMILERAILGGRHVEIQVFGDRFGKVLHFGERDCSVQRRNQKVVEEAPCPALSSETRARMGEAAVKAAQSIHYEGAGTVEFLLDRDGSFYFLEMNTRIQVEHPVTEEVYGVDLVDLQFRIARGESLPFEQQDVVIRRHAIEVRLYAEDPAAGFLPSAGCLQVWQPATGAGIRLDSGVTQGQEITSFYDPMLGKLIAWGEDRETARQRLLRALRQTVVVGPATNRDFLIDVLEQDQFVRGEATTDFLARHYATGFSSPTPRPELIAASVVALKRLEARRLENNHFGAEAIEDPGWRNGELDAIDWSISIDGHDLSVRESNPGYRKSQFIIDKQTYDTSVVAADADSLRLEINGMGIECRLFELAGDGLCLSALGSQLKVRRIVSSSSSGGVGSGTVVAPMHGRVLVVPVNVGFDVAAGQLVAVIESMKMEMQILTSRAGRIAQVFVAEGQQVSAGAPLIALEA